MLTPLWMAASMASGVLTPFAQYIIGLEHQFWNQKDKFKSSSAVVSSAALGRLFNLPKLQCSKL